MELHAAIIKGLVDYDIRGPVGLRQHVTSILGRQRALQFVEEYLTNFAAGHLDNLRLFPQALELLDVLNHKWNVPVGIISNKIGHSLRLEIQHLGLEGRFVFALGAGDVHQEKPEPDFAQAARKHLGQAYKNIWYVGDSAVDLAFAHRVDFLAVYVDHRYPRQIPAASQAQGGDIDPHHLPGEGFRRWAVHEPAICASDLPDLTNKFRQVFII